MKAEKNVRNMYGVDQKLIFLVNYAALRLISYSVSIVMVILRCQEKIFRKFYCVCDLMTTRDHKIQNHLTDHMFEF